jgi:hypothetical protein
MLFFNREAVGELLELEPHFKLFIGIDVLLYLATIAWFNIMSRSITDATLSCH